MKGSLWHYFQDKSSGDEIPHLLFVWETLYFFFILKDTFSGYSFLHLQSQHIEYIIHSLLACKASAEKSSLSRNCVLCWVYYGCCESPPLFLWSYLPLVSSAMIIPYVSWWGNKEVGSVPNGWGSWALTMISLYPIEKSEAQKVSLGTEMLWRQNVTGNMKLFLSSPMHLFLYFFFFSNRVLGPLHWTFGLPQSYCHVCIIFIINNFLLRVSAKIYFCPLTLHAFSDAIFCAGFNPKQECVQIDSFNFQILSNINSNTFKKWLISSLKYQIIHW